MITKNECLVSEKEFVKSMCKHRPIRESKEEKKSYIEEEIDCMEEIKEKSEYEKSQLKCLRALLSK